MNTAAVISYSSYHNPFITECIKQAHKVADKIVVVAYDHFFDGKVDTDLITEFEDEVMLVILPWEAGHESRHYHNVARKTGYNLLALSEKNCEQKFEGVFFIDSDEVLDGDVARKWLDELAEPGEDYKLAHYWYYRDTCFRADHVEEGAVFVSKQTLIGDEIDWMGPRERENFSKRWNYMEGYNGQVLGHHYSWAGTKEMILRKISSWGHNLDNFDWKSMVEREYSQDFNYTCPFKPYTFNKVEPPLGFTFNEDKN